MEKRGTCLNKLNKTSDFFLFGGTYPVVPLYLLPNTKNSINSLIMLNLTYKLFRSSLTEANLFTETGKLVETFIKEELSVDTARIDSLFQ